MICKLCKSSNIRKVLTLHYIGEKKEDQNIFVCDECGMAFSDKSRADAVNRKLNDEKGNFLSRIALDFLKVYLNLEEVGRWNLDFAYFDKRSFYQSIRQYNGLKSIQIVSDALEHSIDIYDMFKRIKKGNMDYVYIQVPVYDEYMMDAVDMYGYFIREHNNYFCTETIEWIMNQLGYVKRGDTINYGGKFKMPMIFPCKLFLFEKRDLLEKGEKQYRKNSIDDYIAACNQYLNEVDNKINRYINDHDRIAIWGTSNYLQKLLGMTSLSKKNIVCFFDGNSSKHGQKILDKEVVPFSKQLIEERRIKYILIASNTAKDAIYKELIDEYRIASNQIIKL